MQKTVAFFKRTEKNGVFRTEKNAVPNPVITTVRHYRDFATLVLSTTYVAADLLTMYSIVRMMFHFFTSTVYSIDFRVLNIIFVASCEENS